MKSQTVENGVSDQLHHRTFVVMATRVLAEGEMYGAIRVELLRRKGKFPAKGETLVIGADNGI